ncbi:MAG: FtsX-like permease family protein, partial [Acidobacteriota bacterium]
VGFRWLSSRLPLPIGFENALSLSWPLTLGALISAPLLALVVVVGPLRALWIETGTSRSVRSRFGLRGSSTGQKALIVSEIALAVILVTSAAVLARSVLEIYDVDLGFETEDVVVVDLFAPAAALDAAARTSYFELIAARVEARPEIVAAAVANRIPLRDSGVQGPLRVETRPDLEDGSLNCKWRYVTPHYFQAFGTTLVAGRGFTIADNPQGVPVGILGARLARHLWPNEDPIGKRVRTGYSRDWIEIVGIAEDVRHDGVLDEPSNVLYRPLAQVRPWEGARLILRTSLDASASLVVARETSQRIDRHVALARPSIMTDIVRGDLSQPLRLRFFLATFSLLALVIGAVGIYGVVSFVVSRRTGEYGLRLALGAEPRELLVSVLADGIRIVLIGTSLGLVGAWLGWRLLAGLLVGVAGSSPGDYLTAAAALLLVGLAASLAPALRAASVDPIQALDPS